MRWVATSKFIDFIQCLEAQPKRVVVVGGGLNDPEVVYLQRNFPEVEIDFFGIENPGVDSFTYLDLNEPSEVTSEYDLVHCAHVLEHIWDVKQGISNLVALARPQGLIWINCPASAKAHGSPHYFSAGYQPRLISNLAELAGAKVMDLGQFGSRRSYIYEHTLMRWPNQGEFESPLLRMTAGSGGRIRAILRWIKYFPQRLLASFFSSQVSDNPQNATQTLVILKKN